jgi:outer membrane protein
LLEQAELALKLAHSRYDLGLSSIVELSQAQLNQSQAEIDGASAKYDYQIAIDDLDFQLGILH